MRGIVSILEVLLAATVIIVSFLFFFPQYSIKTEWDTALLETSVKDTLNTIDRLNKTYDFATNTQAFNDFMNSAFSPQYTGVAIVWWKEVENLSEGSNSTIPYFTRAYKDTIVDVVNTTSGFKIYSFTLGLGFVF